MTKNQVVNQDVPVVDEDLTKKRDEKCIPIAQQALKMMAEKQGQIGNAVDAYAAKLTWTEVARDIIALYLQHDLTLTEVNFVHQLVLQALSNVQNLVVDSLNESLTRLQKKLFDGKILNELSLKELDKLLSSPKA